MKRIIKKAYHLFVLTLLLLSSCSDSDNFSSNSALKIEFPATSIIFDTVFATVASPTREFYIYNRNKHSIAFESIELMDGDKSNFRINVNGQAGTAFRDEELLKKDSLYIMVDVKALAIDEPSRQIEDKIKFTWNGNTEYISLKATVLDVEIWDDKIIASDMQLAASKAYYIRGKVEVKEGVKLSISEGVTLYFDKNGALLINGAIEAIGTIDKPINLRGHRFDFIEQGILYNNVPGQWQGVTVGANSFDNVFDNVRIRNAKNGLNFLASTPDAKKASLTNTILHNMSESGLRAINCNIDAVNCQMTNSKDALVYLMGGKYSFLHCTMGNYYDWHNRTTASIMLYDSKAGEAVPLEAEFVNSIIVGTFHDEISDYLSRDISDCVFRNCVIQSSKKEEGASYVNVEWNIGNVFMFKDLNFDGSSTYSFELIENSSARNKADQAFSNTVANDLRGVSRLADGKPDIGCYEWR